MLTGRNTQQFDTVGTFCALFFSTEKDLKGLAAVTFLVVIRFYRYQKSEKIATPFSSVY